METVCRDCVFAQYTGDKQYGCQLGRLEKFEKNGNIKQISYQVRVDELYQIDELSPKGLFVKTLLPDEILEAKEKEKLSFYSIDRFCTTCRDFSWAKEIPKELWGKKVKDEISLKLSIVCFYRKGNTLEQLKEFVDSCLTQTHLPIEIIILNTDSVKTGITLSKFWDSVQLPDEVTFSNVLILNPKSDNKSLDQLVKKIKGSYFSLFHLPYKLPVNFIKDINTSINENLERFMLLEAEQGHTIQTWIFNKLGNKTDRLLNTETKETTELNNITEKIKWVAEEQNDSSMIKKLTEVVSLVINN